MEKVISNMENKINIAELLKNCPKGMELDCTMYDNVVFDGVSDDTSYPIDVLSDTMKLNLTKTGGYSNSPDAKCVIFPKGKTSWEGFVPPCKFKDGDIILTQADCLGVGLGNTWISIYQEKRNGGVATYVDYAEDGNDYCSNIDGDKGFLCFEKDILRQRLATEEEKKRLFQAIKDNGYKWNPVTKTLEKLPKFKVGDVIVDIYKKHLHCDSGSGKISQITDDKYIFTDGSYIYIQNQDNWELVPNKFDITTLKPFESKVLVRDNDCGEWRCAFWGHLKRGKYMKYDTIRGIYKQCIP